MIVKLTEEWQEIILAIIDKCKSTGVYPAVRYGTRSGTQRVIQFRYRKVAIESSIGWQLNLKMSLPKRKSATEVLIHFSPIQKLIHFEESRH